MSTLEQFVAFSTGSVGLERILRGIESLLMILSSSPVLLTSVLLIYPNLPPRILLIASLNLLKGQLGLARRTIRLFRFLCSFQSSYALYTATPAHADGSKGLEVWVSILAKTSLGLYGLLETATILDLAQIDGLQVWGVKTTSEMNRQAQRFWFVALAGDVVVCVLSMLGVFGAKAVPKDGGVGAETGEKTKPAEPPQVDAVNGVVHTSLEKKEEDQALSKDEELKNERLRLKGVLQKRKAERRAWMRNAGRKLSTLGWKIVSNTLDMTLPARALGWIDLDTATVGWLMLASTFLTGREIWYQACEDVRKK